MKKCKNLIPLYFKVDKLIHRLIIKDLLIRQNIKLNPGPQKFEKITKTKPKTMEIITYNCNGLGNRAKLKRVISKSNKILDNRGIVMLQESHVMKLEQLELLTKHKIQINQFKTNSAGVVTLISNDFIIIENLKVGPGRQLYTVAQRDALSCAIFILCIDPLKRNLDKNSKIKPITLTSKFLKITIQHKASGFADDVSIVCCNDQDSIKEIFREYQRLTNRSGLTLNADKT